MQAGACVVAGGQPCTPARARHVATHATGRLAIPRSGTTLNARKCASADPVPAHTLSLLTLHAVQLPTSCPPLPLCGYLPRARAAPPPLQRVRAAWQTNARIYGHACTPIPIPIPHAAWPLSPRAPASPPPAAPPCPGAVRRRTAPGQGRSGSRGLGGREGWNTERGNSRGYA